MEDNRTVDSSMAMVRKLAVDMSLRGFEIRWEDDLSFVAGWSRRVQTEWLTKITVSQTEKNVLFQMHIPVNEQNRPACLQQLNGWSKISSVSILFLRDGYLVLQGAYLGGYNHHRFILFLAHLTSDIRKLLDAGIQISAAQPAAAPVFRPAGSLNNQPYRAS